MNEDAADMEVPDCSAPSWQFARAGSTILLAAYAVGLVIGTHAPVLPEPLVSHVSDKMLHFGAYAGLAVLAALRLIVYGRVQAAIWFGWAAGLIVAGGVDELTQPMVGRIADWGDWRADVAGVVVGLTIAATGFLVAKSEIRNTESEGNPKS